MSDEPKLMRWWRVELGKDGAIKSCEEVDETSKQGRHVRFVEAQTKAEACSYAKKWYAKNLERDRKRGREKRKILQEQGLCTSCGKRPLETKHLCICCRDRINRRRNERYAGSSLLINLDGNPERHLEMRRQTKLRFEKRQRERVKEQLGAAYAISTVRFFKRLFDKLGPERFRAKLCEVVPDEKAEAAE